MGAIKGDAMSLDYSSCSRYGGTRLGDYGIKPASGGMQARAKRGNTRELTQDAGTESARVGFRAQDFGFGRVSMFKFRSASNLICLASRL